jgi:hypothetical protein
LWSYGLFGLAPLSSAGKFGSYLEARMTLAGGISTVSYHIHVKMLSRLFVLVVCYAIRIGTPWSGARGQATLSDNSALVGGVTMFGGFTRRRGVTSR